MDEMESKQGMIKLLLEMLKSSAAKEVSDGMKPLEGTPDAKGLEIEKVSVMPHDEHMGDESPEEASLADKIMPHGDMAAEGSPAEEAQESPMEEAHEMEDESPAPAFASFMKRKKK